MKGSLIYSGLSIMLCDILSVWIPCMKCVQGFWQFCSVQFISYTDSIRLWSHCIHIWPVFYTDIQGQQWQNKQMCLSKCRWSQWCRAAATCMDVFRQLTVEAKSILFFPAVCAGVSCSFVLSTSMPCFRFFILEENGWYWEIDFFGVWT